jgi:D-aminoacyl-tRNA deacylase
MYLIVISTDDPASMNISRCLKELASWKQKQDMKFENNDVFTYSDLALLVTISQYHLFYDNIASKVVETLKGQDFSCDIDVVIFASKHKSASGLKTLTVHPLGNFDKAEYGGKSQELVPTAPHVMTMAYRYLNEFAKSHNLEHSVTFEATHHGPYLETPAFFIEIGSDETCWADVKAGQTIAQAIMKVIDSDFTSHCDEFPIVIGIGGGHYAPRHSDVARKRCVSFGHIIPNYALNDIPDSMLRRALERTSGVTHVYFHRKALKKDQYRKLRSWFKEQGYPDISSEDLDELG